MDNNKPKKKSQTQVVITSLIITFQTLLALISVSAIYFANFNVFAIILSVFALLYFIFVMIEKNALTTLVRYFRRAMKFKKVHKFFDEIRDKKTELPIKQFFAKETPKRHKHHHKMQRNNEIQKWMQQMQRTTRYVPPQIDYREEYQHHPRRPQTEAQLQAKKKQYQKLYLSIRQQYKRSFEQLCGQEGNRQQFEQIVVKIKNFYIQKVIQLIKMNLINLRSIKEQLEKNYQVKVLENDTDERAVEVININFDTAIIRIQQYKKIGCFPWTLRPDRQEKVAINHNDKLQKIMIERKQIDRFLSPYSPLNQQLRQQIISRLQNQINHPSVLGRQLVQTVAEIFNDRLRINKSDEKYYIYRKDFTIKPTLVIVEAKIQDRYHVDLNLNRADSTKTLICNPGDNNLWTLIGFVIEIIRNRL